MPNTIAAMKPNDRSAASTFSRIESSIVASIPATLAGGSSDAEGAPHRSADPMRASEWLPSKKVVAVQEAERLLVACNQTRGLTGRAATGVCSLYKCACVLVPSSCANGVDMHHM